MECRAPRVVSPCMQSVVRNERKGGKICESIEATRWDFDGMRNTALCRCGTLFRPRRGGVLDRSCTTSRVTSCWLPRVFSSSSFSSPSYGISRTPPPQVSTSSFTATSTSSSTGTAGPGLSPSFEFFHPNPISFSIPLS